ncbi:tigger transposable element-derived protein 1-like [Macrobrachium rosenbergii]|uniref:tigger transposable element-derived protein 1-like n=1 Tax=Macrobrachium rosenbergii TaxID=79674 RepID=UPI0034D6A216
MKLEKVKVVDMLKEDKSFAAAGRHFNVNESTVKYIKKAVEIRKSVSMSYFGRAQTVATVRDKTIVKMESALAFWIKDCRKKNVPLDSSIIHEKARQLYQQLSTATEGDNVAQAEEGVEKGELEFLGFNEPAPTEAEEEAAAEEEDEPQSFIPQVRQYLNDLGMEFKVLLIMDNAGGHPLDHYYKRVHLDFLLPDTTSPLQPMDQGVIRAFTALYIGNSLQHLVNAMDNDSEFTLKDYWHKFTIATCMSDHRQPITE